ncbi:MAG: GNAT family N-acetyltransferase [Candidatus Lokiarchaeota archaeon]|nr:GNAT family N-acetyltransferase [Candidatus Lokiarchaeota archaeon]
MASDVLVFELKQKINFYTEPKYPEGIFIVDYQKSLLKDLWTLWNSTCSVKISLNQLETLECDGVFLATYRNAFVGFVITDLTGDIGEILAIKVAPQYRNLGIGTSLFQKASSYFTEKNAKKIIWVTDNSNEIDPAIIKLAKKFGFTLTRRERLGSKEKKQEGLLKYDYIYFLIKIVCMHCQSKVDFFSVQNLNRCPKCEKPIGMDPMAS